jgi:hypothetical protein
MPPEPIEAVTKPITDFLEVAEQQTGTVKGTLENIKTIADHCRSIVTIGTALGAVFGVFASVQLTTLNKNLNEVQRGVEFQATSVAHIERLQDMATKAAKEGDADVLTLLSDQMKILTDYNGKTEFEYAAVASLQYNALSNFLVRKCQKLPGCAGSAEVRALRDSLPEANEVATIMASQPNQSIVVDLPEPTVQMANEIKNTGTIDPLGWDVDIFTCPEAASKQSAAAISNFLGTLADEKGRSGASQLKLGRIRYREMSTANIKTLGARGQGIEVRANSDEQQVAAELIAKMGPLNLAPTPQLGQSSTPTPWYLSIIVCGRLPS